MVERQRLSELNDAPEQRGAYVLYRMQQSQKVLEWSASSQQGVANLLRLNNSYFLDGRDPSSFANVGWVLGLHDRPWPERAIFGNVRYMNAAGLRRKTDVDRYERTRPRPARPSCWTSAAA